jgi:hypothetical protein
MSFYIFRKSQTLLKIFKLKHFLIICTIRMSNTICEMQRSIKHLSYLIKSQTTMTFNINKKMNKVDCRVRHLLKALNLIYRIPVS